MKRYRLGKVALWVFLVYFVFQLLGVFVIVFLKVPGQEYDLKEVFSWKNDLLLLLGFTYSTFFYYVSLNYFNKLMVEKRPIISYVRYIAIAMIICFLYTFFASQFAQPLHKQTPKPSVALLAFSSFFMSVWYIVISFLIANINNLRDERKQRKQLEIQNLQANYNFLKAQINPHFLHNTLNFFYAKALPCSEELAEGILALSAIMRYALSKDNAIDGKILLKDEVEHLRNVIKINQMRFSNKLNLQFEVEGVSGDEMLIPFVLITIVENAFKHGDLKNEAFPLVIHLQVKDDILTFSCRNKKKMGPKELSTGIGLENIKQRLDVVYGKSYTLHIEEEAEFYATMLTIQLKKY